LQTIDKQVSYGIDVITDGEIYRDTYVFHFLRHCENVDFSNAETITYRNGARKGVLPLITGIYII